MRHLSGWDVHLQCNCLKGSEKGRTVLRRNQHAPMPSKASNAQSRCLPFPSLFVCGPPDLHKDQIQSQKRKTKTSTASVPFLPVHFQQNVTSRLKSILSTSLSPLKAIGLGVRFIKLGGLSRGERITKYNRLFTIEEELLQSGTLGTCCFLALFSLSHE